MLGQNVSQWCRENLSQVSAENELRTTRKGAFLVWRSRNNNMYLSYFDHDSCIHHLPVKQLGRYFFLEGSKFRSLPELVVYHLTLRQFSDNPVKIMNTHTRAKLEATHISLKDMHYSSGETIVSTYRGDLLAEVGRMDDRWLLAKHLPSESFVFFDLIQTSILSDVDAAPKALPYFHESRGVDQDDLVQRFADSGCGSFLIRSSRQNLDAYALLVHTGDKIDKFLLEEVKDTHFCGWRLSGRVFSSISQIIQRYSVRPIHAKTRLTRSILSSGEELYNSEIVASSLLINTVPISPSEEPGIRMQTNSRSASDRIVIACVEALHKCREDKAWISCTVTLCEHAGTAILKMEDILRTDRHSLLLHHTELFCLHDSIFGKDATVFLSPLQNEAGVFLAFEPLHFYTWFHLLKRYTIQRRVKVICPSPSSAMNYYSGFPIECAEMSLLSLHIDKYKGPLLKTDTLYRAVISLNGVVLANTAFQTPISGSCLVFDAHFMLIVTSWSCKMQLSINATGKSRAIAVSSVVNVPVSSMILPSLSSITPSAVGKKPSTGAHAVQFAATYTLQKVTVLSREAYAPLMETLLDEVLTLAEWGSGKLTAVQRNLMCSVMVTLAWPHSLRTLIDRTLGKSMQETSGENMLRQDSFSSCLITAALRLSGKAAFEMSIIQGPTRADVQREEWLVGILAEIARIPAVSLVLACVAATVASHLPSEDKAHVVRRAISAAFVLRFANPLIISALASHGGPALARAVQTAANAATMHNFCRNDSGEGAATRLYDLFERIRDSSVHSVTVEAYNAAPEQCALLCHLLSLALSSCPTAYTVLPTASAASTSSSSSTLTNSESSMASSIIGSGDSTVSADTDLALRCTFSPSFSSSSGTSHGLPELTLSLTRLLDLHRN